MSRALALDPARLEAVDVLADLDDHDRRRLARALEVREVPPGTRLVVQGGSSPGLHIVVSGQVGVLRDVDGRTRDMAVLGPNAVFGEMSLDGGEPAAATIHARIPTTMALLPRSEADLLDRLPGVRARLEDLARRRRAANRIATTDPVEVDTGKVVVRLRPLWPDDWRLMVEARHRASDDSLRKRFFQLPKMTETLFRRLAAVDWDDRFALAALADVDADGHDDLGAVGRYGRLPDDPDTAELAFLVADDLQGKGIGTLLAAALAVAAERHGIRDFTATALAENTAVHHLLERFGAVWHRGDRGQEVEATWPVAAAVAAVDPELRRQLDPLMDLVFAPAD